LEEQKEIQSQFRNQQEKYVYYIIALSIAAIGFCVYKTSGQEIKMSQIPLGLSVISWGLSVFCGLRFLKYSISILFANNTYFEIIKGNYPEIGKNPSLIDAGKSGVKSAINTNSMRATWYFKCQEWLFYLAIILFIVWHILEMILKS